MTLRNSMVRAGKLVRSKKEQQWATCSEVCIASEEDHTPMEYAQKVLGGKLNVHTFGESSFGFESCYCFMKEVLVSFFWPR